MPPATAPVPRHKGKGNRALPSAPPMPQKKVKGKKALLSAPLVDPLTSKRRTGRTIPSEPTTLGVGDWLTDKDILCWFEPRALPHGKRWTKRECVQVDADF